MSYSVFTQAGFWLMVIFSILLPVAVYGALQLKRAISRTTTLLLGFALVLIAGMDVLFLQIIAAAARSSPSLADDAFFVSELSVALYLLPAMFGGIGINVISHVLVSHLVEAEQRFIASRNERGNMPDEIPLRPRRPR